MFRLNWLPLLILPIFASASTPPESGIPSTKTVAQLALPDTAKKTFSTWLNSTFADVGGNISGNGEGYPVGNSQRCHIDGIQLVDFARPDHVLTETFHNREIEPPLHAGAFSVDAALNGTETDLNSLAPMTMARLKNILTLWQDNSPVVTSIVRQKLQNRRWLATPLALKNKLDNLATGIDFNTYLRPWSVCLAANGHDDLTKWTGVIANTLGGKGVLINTQLWSRLGDESRPGLLFHESLRSLQFEDGLPVSDAVVRDIVNAAFTLDPSKQKPGYLDDMLLNFQVSFDFSHANFLHKDDVAPLSLACAINLSDSRIFQSDYLGELISSYQAISSSLPPSATPAPEFQNQDVEITRVAKSLVSERIRSYIGSIALQSFTDKSWYEPTDLTGQAEFIHILTEFKTQTATDCSNFRYDASAESVISPFKAHAIINLAKLLAAMIRQYANAGLLDMDSVVPIYSPDFALPSNFSIENTFGAHLSTSQMGQTDDVIQALGGLQNFQSLNQQYAAWLEIERPFDRADIYWLSDELPWPKSVPGPSLEAFLHLYPSNFSGPP